MNYTSFLNWLINEMQASAQTSLCKLYTDMHAHAHSHTGHMQPLVHSQPEASVMDIMAVPSAHLFIGPYLWVPHITLTLPQVHKWGHFFRSKRLKTFLSSAMCCYPSFFLFRRTDRCKVHRTWRTVPKVCPAKHFGPEHSFLIVCWTDQTRFMK